MVVREIKNVFVNSIDYSYLRYDYTKKKKREQYLSVLGNQVSPAKSFSQNWIETWIVNLGERHY